MQIESSSQDDVVQLSPADTMKPAYDRSPRFYGVAVLLMIIIVSGVWLISRFTHIDRVRDVEVWQEKLNLIAESRASELTGWVQGNYKELRALANNPSLQIYLTELQYAPKEHKPGMEPSQKTYLRNLLLFTAERGGFTTQEPADGIGANTAKESKSGIAILNKQHEILVSTMLTPAMKEEIIRQSMQLEISAQSMTDMRKDADGTLYMGFRIPIYGIQGDGTPESQIGNVIGVRTVGDNLFGLLKHPGVTEKTLEAVILRNKDGVIDYLSPLQDGTSAMTKQERTEDNTGTAANLFANPGSFIDTGADYRGKSAMATSRQIAGTPWLLAVKVDKKEAFEISGQRRANMVAIFALIIVVLCLTVAVMWWYSQSQRSLMLSHHFHKMASKSAAQEKLLRIVADNQPDSIYIVDDLQVCRFANRKAAETAGMAVDALAGKSLADIRGAALAEHTKTQCDQALADNQVQFDTQRVAAKGRDKVTRSVYVPLEQVPVAMMMGKTKGVLVVEQDISEVMHEREERLRIQNQLVQTLVNLVDKRDPFSANHSLLVSQLACSVAEHLELNDQTLDTIRVAGSLMNIGKILVPTELLTKTAGLSDAEKRTISDSMGMAADLIADIHFAGPVADTLRQWPEKFDGTGPKKMQGESILVSARIIAAANAFIGMISPRSWRNAMSVDDANKQLMGQADTQFDRRVVVALIYYVESQAGRAWLKQVMDNKEHVA